MDYGAGVCLPAGVVPPQGMAVVNGAHDQYCAAVGAGVTRPGRVLLSCGTAWVVLAVPQNREAGLCSGMAVSPHAIAGRWGAIRSLGGTAPLRPSTEAGIICGAARPAPVHAERFRNVLLLIFDALFFNCAHTFKCQGLRMGRNR